VGSAIASVGPVAGLPGGLVEKMEIKFEHVWFWRTRLPHRKGQRCRVLIRGGMNSALIEFMDASRCVTSRYAVRKLKKTVIDGERRIQAVLG